jgi:hypothetical protein
VVANILRYVSTYSPPPACTLAYVGAEAGRAQLESAGFSLAPYDDGPLGPGRPVLVVGPGAGDLVGDDVPGLLDKGGRLLAIGLGQKEANMLLPFPVAMSTAEHICTVFDPPGMASLLAGVGPADVMNRGPRDFDLVTGGASVLGDGVLATADDGKVVFCQMPPWSFDYRKYYDLKRTFRRTSYLLTRVLSNMGCPSATPLLERFSSPVADDEAEPRWLKGFYLDEPQEFDDPYRSFGW